MVRRTILVIDGEPRALKSTQCHLKSNGFDVLTASSGEAGLRKADAHLPDLILIDLVLPDLDGLELCKMLKRNPKTAHIPVIIVAETTSEVDRVVALELGAEDYISRPFNSRELILRIHRSLRRDQRSHAPDAESFHFGDLVIDKPAHEVKVRGKPVHLTPIEFKLLTRLAESPQKVHTRDDLLQALWGAGGESTVRTVDTHMRRLRAKLGEAAQHFLTVRGFGYRFVE
jgi:two-component system, OmpR family, phosphate regulon response regulator PhoB